MPMIPLRQIGLEGLIKDKQPEDVPPNGLTSASGVRIEDEAIASVRRSEEVLVFTNVPKMVGTFWIVDNDDQIISVQQDGPLGVGGNVTIIATDISGVDTDVSPVAPLTPSEYWWGVQYGTAFFITNGIDVPQVLFDTDIGTLPFASMVGWPTEYRCDVIDGFKGFIFATSIRLNGVASPSMVKWSHPVAAGDAEFFWDFTNPQLLAGEAIILTSGRSTVSLQRVADTLILYFDQSVWRIDLIGGQFVFNFDQAFRDDGIVSPFGSTEVHGQAIVFGNRDIYVHDGIDKKSLTDRRLTKWVYDNIKLDYPVRTAYYPRRNEVNFFVRTQTTGEANIILVWNEVYDAWTDVNTIEQGGSGILFDGFIGPRLDAVITTYADLFAADTSYFELTNTTYNDFEQVDEEQVFYTVSQTTKQLINLDSARLITPVPGPIDISASIEHSRMDLDELLGDTGEKIKYLNRVYPQIRGFGIINFTFGSAETAVSGIRWENPVPFDIEKDLAVDIRVTGRYLAYRIDADINIARFFLSGMDLDIDVAGVQ